MVVINEEARRRRARENGAKSRGPLSNETKFISSRNGLTDGGYSRVHHLNDENPHEIHALRERYLASAQPESPFEEFLVTECFQGHLAAGRVHRARTTELNRQQRIGIEAWQRDRASLAE